MPKKEKSEPTLIGSYIKSELDRRGWQQSDFAAKIKLSTSALSSIIVGATKIPKPSTIRAMAQVLDVDGAMLTALLGYPVATGANARRYEEIDARLEAAPWVMQRLPDLLRLSQARFEELMRYLDFRQSKQ